MVNDDVNTRKIADSMNTLLEAVKGSTLSGADAVQVLHEIGTSAELKASELSDELKQQNAPELFAVLREVMHWYRNRTTPEMPFQLQERALDVLWRAKGKPTGGDILDR